MIWSVRILLFADQQLRYALTETENVRISLGKTPEELPSPRNIQSDGSLRLVRARDWCSGFFPGELWYMYEYTKMILEKRTEFQTELLEPLKSYKGTHDLGLCSIVVMATDTVWSNRININRYCWRGQTLWPLVLTRWSVVFVPGIINGDKWQYPVIIDNMMNLEFLFWATKASGDSTF